MVNNADLFELFNSLSSEDREAFTELLECGVSSDEFARVLMVGACPFCGSDKTMDCSNTTMEDITVGFCGSCLRNWCLECNHELFDSYCPHWEICDSCEFLEITEDLVVCRGNVKPIECPIIEEKMKETGQHTVKDK